MTPDPENTQYVDLPDVRETFSDCLGLALFDGTQVRLEFQITRLDPPEPPGPPTGRRYPVSRMVLTPQCAIQLSNQLNTFLQVMRQKGMIKDKPPMKAAN